MLYSTTKEFTNVFSQMYENHKTMYMDSTGICMDIDGQNFKLKKETPGVTKY